MSHIVFMNYEAIALPIMKKPVLSQLFPNYPLRFENQLWLSKSLTLIYLQANCFSIEVSGRLHIFPYKFNTRICTNPSNGMSPECIYGEGSAAVTCKARKIYASEFLNMVSNSLIVVSLGKYNSSPYTRTEISYTFRRWTDVSMAMPFSPCSPVDIKLYNVCLPFWIFTYIAVLASVGLEDLSRPTWVALSTIGMSVFP